MVEVVMGLKSYYKCSTRLLEIPQTCLSFFDRNKLFSLFNFEISSLLALGNRTIIVNYTLINLFSMLLDTSRNICTKNKQDLDGIFDMGTTP
jgi:hypothetical protein